MRPRALGPVLFSALLLAAVPAVLAAQIPDTLQGLRDAVARAAPNSVVRVVLRDAQRHVGRLNPRLDSIEVSGSSGGSTTIGLDAVASFSRRRRATLEGAVGGALIPVLLGVAVSADCADCGSLVGPVVVLGALGAGVGALVGTAFPHWRTVWRRPVDRHAGRNGAIPPFAVVMRGDPVGARSGEIAPVGELTVMMNGGYQMISAGSVNERGGVAGGAIGLAIRFHGAGIGPELGLIKGSVEDLRTYALIGRFDLRHARSAPGRIPYLVVGVDQYSWVDHHSVKSMVLGVGYTAPRHTRVELRWHRQLPEAHIDTTTLTIGAGRSFAW